MARRPAPAGPFSAADYDTLAAALAAVQHADEIIQKAHATGMDVRSHNQLSQYLRSRLEAMRSHFFPSGRPS